MSTTTSNSNTTGLQSSDVAKMMASQSDNFNTAFNALMTNNNKQLDTLQSNVNANTATMTGFMNTLQTQMSAQGNQISAALTSTMGTINGVLNAITQNMFLNQSSAQNNLLSGFFNSNQNGSSSKFYAIT